MLTELIYEGLEVQARRDRRKSKNLTASIISPCSRKNFYRFAKMVEEDSDAGPNGILLMKFRDGNNAHEDLAIMLRELEFDVVDTEFKAMCGTIYSRVDLAIRLDGMVYNLEFKTMAPNSFETFVNHGIKAFPQYHAQAQVIANSKPTRPLIEMAKNKGTSEFHDEIVKPDLEFIEHLKFIKSGWDSAKESGFRLEDIPDRGFSYGSSECSSCDFKVDCWFKELQDDVIGSEQLTSKELAFLKSLQEELRGYKDNYEAFLEVEQEFKAFTAFLHTKYKKRRVRVANLLSSTSIQFLKSKLDLGVLRSMVDEKELDKAYYFEEVAFFRTDIKLKHRGSRI